MGPILFSQRPHEKTVDFARAKFIVSFDGLVIDGEKYKTGDVVPDGKLDSEALRQLYERPLRRIELVEYAMTLPHLREACARRGGAEDDESEPELDEGKLATFVQAESPEPIIPDLGSLSKNELAQLCAENGLQSDGSKRVLRKRLEALLG